jgi:hypothetical protein
MLELIVNYIQNVRDVPDVSNVIESARRSMNLRTYFIYYMKFA